MSNVITTRNLGIMNMNVERNDEINKEAMSISPTMKENPLKQCFFHAIFLKTLTTRIFGCWTMVVTII